MKNEGDVSIVDTEKANARLEMYNNCLGLMWDASKMAESDLKNDVVSWKEDGCE